MLILKIFLSSNSSAFVITIRCNGRNKTLQTHISHGLLRFNNNTNTMHPYSVRDIQAKEGATFCS